MVRLKRNIASMDETMYSSKKATPKYMRKITVTLLRYDEHVFHKNSMRNSSTIQKVLKIKVRIYVCKFKEFLYR